MSIPAALAAHYQQLLGLVKAWKITDVDHQRTGEVADECNGESELTPILWTKIGVELFIR